MYSSVRANFIAFNSRFEGRMHCMYLDTHDPPLVTTGVGNLIDPVTIAVKLPFAWKNRPGRPPATPIEIANEWNRVKSRIPYIHVHSSIWDMITDLSLDDAAIDVLVLDKAGQNEAILKKRPAYAQFDTWPADAQLALHSMAWAMGPGFHFPALAESCQKRDFASAARQCKMDDRNNPGLTPRNAANVQLFTNASKVQSPGSGLAPDRLYFPGVL
jgi:hypothetical protein